MAGSKVAALSNAQRAMMSSKSFLHKQDRLSKLNNCTSQEANPQDIMRAKHAALGAAMGMQQIGMTHVL